MVFLFCFYMIVELLVSHEFACISACWILLEALRFVLVFFHLTSFCFSCLALDVLLLLFWLSDVLLFLGICGH